jgi:phosphoribosylamine--glycine ligase/phosphoribosylformylglycinamidine cyclo-ligase
LAAGKGVIIPQTKEEAHKALREMMLDHQFGDAGNEVVIEEYLEGDELSILTFSDGYTIRSLPPAQDHKRIFDGDQGPNTGGMGCYAPTPISSKEVLEEIDRTIVQPTVDGMRKDGSSDSTNFELYRTYANSFDEIRFPLCGYPLHWSHDDQGRP